MKNLVLGVAGLALLAAPLAASAQPYGYGHGYGHYREGRGDYGRGYERDDYGRDGYEGAALAAGIAGLAVGAALADRDDDAPAYGYRYAPAYGYAPGYGYGYGYGYGPRCVWRNQPYRTYYGGIAYRHVEICR